MLDALVVSRTGRSSVQKERGQHPSLQLMPIICITTISSKNRQDLRLLAQKPHVLSCFRPVFPPTIFWALRVVSASTRLRGGEVKPFPPQPPVAREAGAPIAGGAPRPSLARAARPTPRPLALPCAAWALEPRAGGCVFGTRIRLCPSPGSGAGRRQLPSVRRDFIPQKNSYNTLILSPLMSSENFVIERS